MTAPDRRCPRCGAVKPVTEEFWYFRTTGGLATRYCKPCQVRYGHAWEAALTPARLARRRLQQRNSARRAAAALGRASPDRRRPSKYEVPVDGAPCPSCASRRTELARTRDGTVFLCWGCGVRVAS